MFIRLFVYLFIISIIVLFFYFHYSYDSLSIHLPRRNHQKARLLLALRLRYCSSHSIQRMVFDRSVVEVPSHPTLNADIQVETIDVNINDTSFSEKAVELLLSLQPQAMSV